MSTRLRRLGAVGAGAALYALAMPPVDVAVLAWVTLVPLLLVIRTARPVAAFGYGAVYGFVAAATVTWWLVPVAANYFQTSFLVAALAMSAAYALAVSSTCGLFAAGAADLLRRRGFGTAAVGVPALWVAAEAIRGRLLAQPWGLLGYTQHAHPAVLQVATVTGVYGVSAALVLANLTLAETVAAVRAHQPWRRIVATAAPPTVVLALLVTIGAVALPAAREPADGPTIALVQANLPPAFRWTRSHAERQLHANLRLTAERAASLRPALVVWPENALTLQLDTEPLVAATLARLAAETGADLLIGTPRAEGGRAFNSVRLIRADGLRGGHYDKQRLVLFAETPAFGGPPPLGSGESPRAFSAGGTPGLLRGQLPLGVSICHEILYPPAVLPAVAEGAEVLVNVANDGWLDAGHGVGSRQHAAMAVLRAVETRRFLVRAATTGMSAIIDPWGRPLVMGPPGMAGVFSARIVPRRDQTPYVRFGDAFAVLCGLGATGMLVWRRIRSPALAPSRPVLAP